MKFYVAGPMTGLEYFNFPAFDKAKRYLLESEKATEVFNPADHDRSLLGMKDGWLPTSEHHDGNWKFWTMKDAPSLRDMLGADVAWIAKNADGLYMLKGWENSKGANAEWALAKALGLEIMYA